MTSTFRRGTKVFTVSFKGDQVVFRCSCDALPGSDVVVTLPVTQAKALLEGRPAREVLAGKSFEVVELFRTGLTPAEFDQAYGGNVRPDYPHYVRAGGSTGEPAPPARSSPDNVGTLF